MKYLEGWARTKSRTSMHEHAIREKTKLYRNLCICQKDGNYKAVKLFMHYKKCAHAYMRRFSFSK